MDAFDPRKALLTFCPGIGTKQCCWGIKDLGYLGLGTALYLNFMRWMAFTFFLIGLLSVHNAYQNSFGDRYTQSTLGPIEYGATHPSIANLGNQNWTAAGDNYCSGHGFAAQVCAQDGWMGSEESAWHYPCGTAPDTLMTEERSLTRFVFGGVDVKCEKKVTECSCMPGWAGAQCDVPTVGGTAGVNGWCMPPTTWWNTTDAQARLDGDDLTYRDASFCSGHGHCAARTDEVHTTSLMYTFCQCDEGYYGEKCENTVSSTDVYGDYYNYAFTEKDSEKCNPGTLPEIVREFFNVKFPSATCRNHGFGLKLNLAGSGKLIKSNAYRVQTPAVCYCEPGFNGEECLGGEAVPDAQGWIHGACSAVLLIMVAVLYRDRKRMQRAFNIEVMTSADFTVFVNHLPMVKLENVPDVKKHFSQYGEVHFVSPAMADNKLILLQRERNMVLSYLQIFQENEAFDRKMEGWQRAVTAAKASGDKQELAKVMKNKPGPVSLPPFTANNTHPDEQEAWIHSVKPWEITLANFQFRWLGFFMLSRKFLFKYLVYLNGAIQREIQQPEVNSFARAFVTFKTVTARERCLEAYSERRDGMFGKLGDVDPSILYLGKHWIDVSPSSEPGEVQWESLAVGPRVRGLLMTLSVFIMIAIVAGMFQLVLVINESKATGIIGLLITLAVLALNVIVAQFWVDSAGLEQHYNAGASMRSVYLKTLVTQIFITLLAGTIGVYGYPIDGKNGYVQDWYKEAGGFVFRMVLIESIIPPLVDIINPAYRMNLYFGSTAKSVVAKSIFEAPVPSILAMRCASLMRTVIMCAAFNAGLPVLNLAVAFGLYIRYQADKWCYKNMFMVKQSGPELARALELSLMFAAAVQIVMGWVTLRAGWASNLITEAIFYIGTIGAMWAIFGYFSYRWFRGRDCWCGTGPIIPCVNWLCCFNERLLSPFFAIHKAFMVLIFGVGFFASAAQKRRGGESNGMTYDVVMCSHGLRRIPYYVYERGQMFPDLMSDELQPVPLNGPQTVAKIAEDKRLRKTGTDLVQLTVSPYMQMQKTEKMKIIAANKATSMGMAAGGELGSMVIGVNPLARQTTTGVAKT